MSESKDREIYLMFAPLSGRGLKVDYPELSEYEELAVLRMNELLFVWYYACKTSPYFNDDKSSEREIVEKCLEASKLRFDDPAQKERYLSLNFPEKIQAAITVMNSFEPSVRILAKLSAVKAMNDVKKMVSIKLDENGNHPQFLNKDGEIDSQKKKNHMSMILTSQKEMADLIARSERGYGITSKKASGNKNLDEAGYTFMESYHENN